MKVTVKWGLTLFVGIVMTTANAEPSPEQFLICIPGGPGSAEEAGDRLKTFLDALGEGVVPLEGHYAVTKNGCDKVLKEKQPRFALFSHTEYRARASTLKAVPLLSVAPLDGLPMQYFIVARKGSSMDSVKGGSLISPHWSDEKLLSEVAFERDLATHFQGKKGSALRALKKVVKGKADVALLNAVEYKSMKELRFADQLEVILQSVELPALAIVEIGGVTELGKKLTARGKTLCTSESDACKSVEMSGLKSPELKDYQKLLK